MTKPVLALDLGGTKILAALVEDGRVLERRLIATDPSAGPDIWLSQIGDLVQDWSGLWSAAGMTVTGLIQGQTWSALNPITLGLPEGGYPLAERAAAILGAPVTLANDAQAAAWGEYRHGAGQGRDMVFLTISTGVGGGIVTGGKLLQGRGGLAGHVGILPPLPDDPTGFDKFENSASGRFITKMSGQSDARAAFEAKDPASEAAIALSAARVARLARSLQLLLDPELIVMGGGVGMAEGYLAKVQAEFAGLRDVLTPTLVPAALGADAGVIGIAALAKTAAA